MRTPLVVIGRDRRFRTLFWLILCAGVLSTAALGVALYLRAERAAREQAVVSNTLVLGQLDRSVDAVLAEFDKSFASLILDFAVAEFSDYYREHDYLMMSRVYRSLFDFLALNPWVNSVHVYYRDVDIVLSPHRGVVAGGSYYDYPLIQDVLEGTQAPGWIDVREVPDTLTGEPVPVLTVVKPIPLVSYAPRALVVVTIREGFLPQIVSDIQAATEGTVFAVSSTGTILGRSTPGRDAGIASHVLEGHTSSSGSFLIGRSSGRSLVSYVRSSRYPWTYVYVLPYRSVVGWIDALKVWWLGAVLVTAFLSIGASLAISVMSYAAVSGVAARFRGAVQGPATRDLLGSIGEGIDALRRHSIDVEALLETAKPGLRNAFLLRLLKGNTDSHDLSPGRFDYYGLRAHTYPGVFIILIRPDEADHYRLRYTEHEKNLLSVRYQALVSAVLPSGAAADVLDDDPMEIRIVVGLGPVADDEIVATFARRLQAEARRLLNHPVTVGVSDRHAGVGELNAAYREACRALDYRLVLGGNRAIEHREVPVLADAALEYPYAEERQLLESLKAGSTERTERLLEVILTGGNTGRAVSPHHARFVKVQLLCSVMSFCAEIGATNELAAGEDPFAALLTQGPPEEARQWFLALFARIGAFITRSRFERNTSLVRAVEEYVHAHYQNRDLSLVRIADAVYYSVPHVCRVFRDVTGTSVKDLVDRVRADRAKELLADSTLSVSAVAQAVGYDRLQSFIKLFKRQAGVTPSDFRRLHCAAGSKTTAMIRKDKT